MGKDSGGYHGYGEVRYRRDPGDAARIQDLERKLGIAFAALEDIRSKSQDNWAAARAETGLGIGKAAVIDD